MTDVRENLGWLLGSIATTLALIFGWIYQSGVLNTLVGVAIGAGITYYVQTKTQNRAWKREYAVKIAEQVYGALFKGVKTIMQSLAEKSYIYWIGFDSWREFQQDHRYFMVDEDFRARLDSFNEKLERYSRMSIKLASTIRRIVIEEIKRVFDIKTDQIPQVVVFYKKGYTTSSTMPDLIRCLISETHPKTIPERIEPESSDVELIFNVTSIDNKVSHIPYSKEFDEFWQACLGRMKEDETYKSVVEENTKILVESKEIISEIVKRIEKPWKI